MCIGIGDAPQVIKIGPLALWKVVRKDNQIGLWSGTGWREAIEVSDTYNIGVNVANAFTTGLVNPTTSPGQFHCFFTRNEARKYMNFRYNLCPIFCEVKSKKTKIIRVYADSSDVVKIGKDDNSRIRAISVSKMEIRSLNHQR